MLLRGKTALITGCLKGIGFETMKLFAQHGANVWACCQKEDAAFTEAAAKLAEGAGVWIRPLVFDLTDAEQVKAALRQVAAAKVPVDVLVNNAGMTQDALFQMTSMDSMKKVFEVNFFAQMLVTQYVAKLMARAHAGSIVNVSSITAVDGNPGQLSYAASKAAVLGATKTLAAELAEHGIRVNAVAPGIIQTDMTAAIPAARFQEMVAAIPMKRPGLPPEVAGAMLFLASDLSSYVTGQLLRVDGGIG